MSELVIIGNCRNSYMYIYVSCWTHLTGINSFIFFKTMSEERRKHLFPPISILNCFSLSIILFSIVVIIHSSFYFGLFIAVLFHIFFPFNYQLQGSQWCNGLRHMPLTFHLCHPRFNSRCWH
jgi:hypothetical protein